MSARAGQPGGIDPFDVMWNTTDPLNREVVMLKSVARHRDSLGKHSMPPEHLSVMDAKSVVNDPDRIDESVSYGSRNIYYQVDNAEENPCARVVVDFKGDVKKGTVVSWSRYKKPVASYGVVWSKERS